MAPDNRGDIQKMVEHLDSDMNELKRMFKGQREKTGDQFDEMLNLLHRIDKNQVSQANKIESNRADIRLHRQYFYIIWLFIAGVFMAFFKLWVSGGLG